MSFITDWVHSNALPYNGYVHIFSYSPLNDIDDTCNHQKQGMWLSARLLVLHGFYLIAIVTSQGSFFGSIPYFWLVHLAVITSIATNTPICYASIKSTDVGMAA